MWSPKLYKWYHGNCICGRYYQLPPISIMLIYEKIFSKAEQKWMFTRYQTCYTNSTKVSMHESIWKNQQPPTVFLHDVKNLDSVETLRTLQKHHQQAYLCPESFAILRAISDCFVWRSSVPPWHKQFSHAHSAVESTKVTCSWSTQRLNSI